MESQKLELLEALKELWELAPDYRVGQLVVLVAQLARGPEVNSVYEVGNVEFLAACRRLIVGRKTGVPAQGFGPTE